MFGLGMYSTYSVYQIDAFGGINAALLVALFTRILVGIGWYQQFSRSGKKGYLALIPIVGPYHAFRLVWDDFSWAALFGMTSFIAFVNAVGVQYGIITACSIFNFIMWWFMALLTTRAYGTSMILGFLYGGIPWLGVMLTGFWPSASYRGPWSSDPEADQNVSNAERKKRRKKAAKSAKKGQ